MNTAKDKVNMDKVATTLEIERKRELLKGNLSNLSESSLKFMDIYRDFSDYTEKKKNITDKPAQGYSRILGNFQQQCVGYIKNVIRKHPNKKYRFLTILPDESTNKDDLRNAWVGIQKSAGLKTQYIPSGNNELPSRLKASLSKFSNDETCPVFSMEMQTHALKEMLEWACKIYSEVVLINAEFEGNLDNFALLVNMIREHPNKIHLYGSYWDLFNYGIAEQSPMVATILLAQGLKSVSFQRAPPPYWLYSIPSIRTKPRKTEAEKYSISLWINDETMSYEKEHPKRCSCFPKKTSVNKLCLNVGTESVLCHHNIASLSKRYDLMTKDKTERNRILSLETIEPLVTKLQSVGATFD